MEEKNTSLPIIHSEDDIPETMLEEIGSISGNTTEIAVETDVDLNNHKITNLGAPTEANDAMNKATASVAGIVKQAAAVTDASDNAVTTINELLVSLRNADILASS